MAISNSAALVVADLNPIPAAVDPERFLENWAKFGRTYASRRIYRGHLRLFGEAHGLTDTEVAAQLLTAGRPRAVAVITAHLGEMEDAGRSPSYRATRLTVLRSLIQYAELIGVIDWSLPPGLKRPKVEPYRDTRGPGIEAVWVMIDAASAQPGRAGYRDPAILHLLGLRGLRRAEVTGLDLEHFDPGQDRVRVLAKGHQVRAWVTIAPETTTVLRAWVANRGFHPGPLFHGLNQHGRSAERLSANAVRLIVKRGARLAGQDPDKVWPHALRHAAITHALEVSGGNVRDVAKFSGHSKLSTVAIYDDAREDVGGRIARAVTQHPKEP